MNEIQIRAARHDDIPALSGLLKLLFEIEADFSFDAEKQARGLELLLESAENCCVFVAENDDEIIGMCSVQTLISTAQGAPKGWIEDVCVAEDFRGSGIGKMLLQAVDVWCLERGIRRLNILCDTQNTPAQRFYERIGWQPTQLQCLVRFADE